MTTRIAGIFGRCLVGLALVAATIGSPSQAVTLTGVTPPLRLENMLENSPAPAPICNDTGSSDRGAFPSSTKSLSCAAAYENQRCPVVGAVIFCDDEGNGARCECVRTGPRRNDPLLWSCV